LKESILINPSKGCMYSCNCTLYIWPRSNSVDCRPSFST